MNNAEFGEVPKRLARMSGVLLMQILTCSVSHATDLIGGAQPEMLTPPEALQAFVLPGEYEINLYASEVEFPIQSPAAMTFDSEGRLWVACVRSHPHAIPGVDPRDSLIVFEDGDRNGAADKCTVFYDKLYLPMGFALAQGGRTVYVVSQPDLLRLTDTDGDLVADEARIELSGLGTEDNHHVASAFQWGPDGRLYFAQGLFLNTQVETPYGPMRAYEGTVFRFDPRDQRLEAFGSFGWSNPWGIVFDHWGQPLLADASPGLNYYLPYMTSNFTYPKPDKYVNYTTVRNSYSFTPEGRRPSCGCELLLSEHFPEDVRGWYVTTQMKGWHGLRWYALHEEGAGVGATQPRGEDELLTTTDVTFRPSALQIGPDGALYVLDYYNPIVGHTTYNFRDARRIQTHGRVWRITHKTRPLVWGPEIRGQPVVKLLEHLKNPNYRTRYFVRRELQQRAAANVIPKLEMWVNTLDIGDSDYEHHLLEALWIRQGLNQLDLELLKKLLAARDHRARAAAVRVLRFWQDGMDPDQSLAMLREAMRDESQKVRLEALLATGYHRWPAKAIGVAAMALDQEMDAGFRLAASDTLKYLSGRVAAVPLAAERFLIPFSRDEELISRELSEDVCLEILRRPGLGIEKHLEALTLLGERRGLPPLAAAVEILESGKDGEEFADTLPRLLLNWPGDWKASQKPEEHAITLIHSKDREVRQHGYALLMKSQQDTSHAIDIASAQGGAGTVDLLKAIALLRRDDSPPEVFAFVAENLRSGSEAVRESAVAAISNVRGREGEAFELLADLSDRESAAGRLALSFAAMKSMARIPRAKWPEDYSPRILTTIQITTNPDLRFEPAEFTVPVGSAVDLDILNPDNLYHNLVIVKPGAAEDVGIAADAMAATPEGLEKNYVPDAPAVLHWTPQLGMRKRHRLQFLAPSEPGEYPYICTFPGHWRVMRGVMKVVDG